jgi:hypothetical protein
VNGAWRLLIHDPDPDDPKWILATVVELADVCPAQPAGSTPDDVTARWVTGRTRAPVTLTALPHARVWRADQEDAQP